MGDRFHFDDARHAVRRGRLRSAGVTRSDGLPCFATNQDQAAFRAARPVFPAETEQAKTFLDTYNAFGQRCLGSGQRIVGHMSTADVARDLDLLR